MPADSARCISIWQWCFPSRRQQRGLLEETEARDAGWTLAKASRKSTKLAANRRIGGFGVRGYIGPGPFFFVFS